MPADNLRDRLTDALLHVRGLCVGDPDTSAANVMDARRDADAVLAALPADPGNLPARMAEVIGSHEWTDFPRSAHNQHNYYGACAVCQRDILRMAEVALGVRDELVAHLSARVAEAEARVGHAEAGAELSSERLAKVRQELAREKDNVQAWIRSANAWQARAEQAEALIRGLVYSDDCWFDQRGGCRAHGYLSLESGEHCPQGEAKELLAALTAPAEGTTTPARETA